jgi:hypothetical protein
MNPGGGNGENRKRQKGGDSDLDLADKYKHPCLLGAGWKADFRFKSALGFEARNYERNLSFHLWKLG